MRVPDTLRDNDSIYVRLMNKQKTGQNVYFVSFLVTTNQILTYFVNNAMKI